MHNCNDHFMFFCCCFSFFFKYCFSFHWNEQDIARTLFYIVEIWIQQLHEKTLTIIQKMFWFLVKDPVCNVQQFLLAFIERKMKVFLEKQEFNRQFPWDIWQTRKFMDHYRLCSLISEKIDAKCNFLKTFWDMECLPWLIWFKVRLSIESRIKYD